MCLCVRVYMCVRVQGTVWIEPDKCDSMLHVEGQSQYVERVYICRVSWCRLRALSVMAGQTVGLSGEHCLFDPNSPSQMLHPWGIGSNDVTCALVPVVRV